MATAFFFLAADADAPPSPPHPPSTGGRATGPPFATRTRDIVKRALTEDEARFYVSEIVAALEWVHLHGYVYRYGRWPFVYSVVRACVRAVNALGERRVQ